MATYDNLPVYKVCYELLIDLFKASGNMQRDFRFTLGEAMKKELLELMVNVYRANSRQDKYELLTKARENIEVLRLLLRLTNDLKQISLKLFITSNERIESISKQLTSWSRSCNNK